MKSILITFMIVSLLLAGCRQKEELVTTLKVEQTGSSSALNTNNDLGIFLMDGNNLFEDCECSANIHASWIHGVYLTKDIYLGAESAKVFVYAPYDKSNTDIHTIKVDIRKQKQFYYQVNTSEVNATESVAKIELRELLATISVKNNGMMARDFILKDIQYQAVYDLLIGTQTLLEAGTDVKAIDETALILPGEYETVTIQNESGEIIRTKKFKALAGEHIIIDTNNGIIEKTSH